MVDHVSVGVTSLERSRRFYDAALRPIGVVRILDFEERGSDYGTMVAPFGVEFTITAESGVAPSPGIHVCFRATDRQAVRALSTPPRWKLAAATTGRPASVRSIIATTMALLFLIPMVIA